MKEKIYIFIIGVLVGAVVATGAFLIYSKNSVIAFPVFLTMLKDLFRFDINIIAFGSWVM